MISFEKLLELNEAALASGNHDFLKAVQLLIKESSINEERKRFIDRMKTQTEVLMKTLNTAANVIDDKEGAPQ